MKNEAKEVVWNLFTGNKKQDLWTNRWNFVRFFVTFFLDLKNWVTKDPHGGPPLQDGWVRVSSELWHLVDCGKNKTTHTLILGYTKELSPYQKEKSTNLELTSCSHIIRTKTQETMFWGVSVLWSANRKSLFFFNQLPSAPLCQIPFLVP